VALSFLFTGETVGLFLCSLFYDVGIANMLSAVMFSLFLLMCGYFRGASSLPYPLRYANYGLITYYGAEVLAINEFHDLSLSCSASQSINGRST
jgi:ABC-type multidrug transport system permease subunit